jgi:all-trans-retinol 13,14-reductase
MVQSNLIKKVYRSRIKGLANSISVFSINMVMKKDTFKYLNHNIYYFGKEGVWDIINYQPEEWPSGFALFFSTSSKQNGFAEGVTLMTYMRYEKTHLIPCWMSKAGADRMSSSKKRKQRS